MVMLVPEKFFGNSSNKVETLAYWQIKQTISSKAPKVFGSLGYSYILQSLRRPLNLSETFHQLIK